MSEDVHRILEENTLRKTDIRRRVLTAFTQVDHALSQGQLEEMLDDADRVTLYRTLRTFEEKGIVHVAYDGQNDTKYALCQDDCHPGHHADEHVHFYCTACGKTYCLEHSEVPSVTVPDGFSIQAASFFVQGTCDGCAA